MIDNSEYSSWIMLKNNPRKTVRLTNPLRLLERFHGARLCASSRNMNLGPEHIGQERNLYDLPGTLPPDGLTKEEWPIFWRAIDHMMPDSMID
eukprot:9653927-Karenia_brevis.AAC.1